MPPENPSPLYDVIYADPPWSYGNRPGRSDGKFGDIEGQYPTMHIDDICALPVPAAKNSVLYLWATSPLLPEAMRVIDAWGFRYKSSAVWDKGRARLGYWFRGQHEFLLVGTRGRVSPPAPALRRSSVFTDPAGRHSAKPEKVRDFIRDAFPDARRLEMFCRTPAPGWDVWGNEVDVTAVGLPDPA